MLLVIIIGVSGTSRAFGASATAGALHASFFIPDDFINGKGDESGYDKNYNKIDCVHNQATCMPADPCTLLPPFLIR